MWPFVTIIITTIEASGIRKDNLRVSFANFSSRAKYYRNSHDSASHGTL